MLGPKLGEKAKSHKNLLCTLEGSFFSLILMNLGQNVCLNDISGEYENGSSWSKTRSLYQISVKPCVCSRGHIFCSVLLKFDQNVCFGDFLDKFENGSY